MDQLRIFISSPGDVGEERRRTAIVVQRIRREFSRFFDVSAILWEYDPMLSSGHFQDIIEKPSNTDIVVLILWSRLGTALPSDRYKGIDGRTPVTGTEWEFEDALAAKRDRGTPDLLVYRKTSPPQASFADPAELERAQQQWGKLQDFWLRYFVDKDGTFKAAFNQFAALDEYEHLLEMHLRSLLHERVTKLLRAEGKRPVSWHSGSPFRGLSVFGPEHAAIFFGREKAEQELVEILARRADAGSAFVIVFGASGSGKSSLLRAGVLPTVESPGVVPGVVRWRRLIFTPAELGADPFAGLTERLLAVDTLPEASKVGDTVSWRRQFAAQPEQAAAGIRDALGAAAQAAGLAGGALPLRLFLLVDQLEEIFTAPSFSADARAAFAGLLEALAKSGAVWIAGSMRSDFFSRLTEVEALAALAARDGGYALAAPRGPEIERMIQKPAEVAGITFQIDPVTGIGLDSELLEAATQSPGALPLLEFTLDELYRRDIEMRGGDFLTFETFKSLGGLEGSIAAQAEATVTALPHDVVRALPSVIRSLVLVGDDDRIGARTAPAAELKASPDIAALTDALVAARLLVISGDGGVKVAHEALLRAWPRAASMIAQDMHLLRARARAEQAMHRWLSEKEAPDFLLPRGRSLAEAAELLAARRDELAADLVRYIEDSAAADEARRQGELAAERARAEAKAEAARARAQQAAEQAAAAQRLARRTRIAAAILGVLLLIAVGAGVYASIQRAQAVRQRNAALASQSHFLADAASAAADSGDARLARLLALAALPHDLANPDRPYVASAEAALAQSWSEDRLQAILPADAAKPASTKPAPNAKPGRYAKRTALLLSVIPKLNTLSFAASGQGDRIVISGEGHARVYDLDSKVLLDAPHRADKGAAVLDTAGVRMAQGDGAGMRLWNVDARTSRRLQGASATDVTLKIAFSPDGSRLIAGGVKGTVSIWSLPEGKPMTVPGVTGPVYDIRISSNGKRAVVMGADGVAGLYDLAAGKLVAMLGDSSQRAGDINARTLRQGVSFLSRFSGDGALLATAVDATRAQLWDATTGGAIGGVMAHDGPVQAFRFDGEDKLDVSLVDGRTYVWSIRSRGEARLVWAHAEAAQPAPEADELLITDDAGLHVTDYAGHTLRTLLAGSGLTDGAWSPDGTFVAVTVNGESVVLIPASGGMAKTIYRAKVGQRIALADFTDAGNRLVVFNQSGPSMLLDASSGRTIATLGDGKQNLAFIRHSGQIVAYWPSGKALVYGADGHTRPLDAPPGFSIVGFTGDATVKLGASVGAGSATVFWNLESGKAVGKIDDGKSFEATRAAFYAASDGWVARGDVNQSISIWPWNGQGAPQVNGPAVKTLNGHAGLIIRMRVTPQGRLLSEGRDKTAMLWDPLSGRLLVRYDGVGSSRLSEDGKRLAIIDGSGAVRLAHLPPTGQALLDAARARYGSLSTGEQARYFLSPEAKSQ